jgi:hypothetical protein
LNLPGQVVEWHRLHVRALFAGIGGPSYRGQEVFLNPPVQVISVQVLHDFRFLVLLVVDKEVEESATEDASSTRIVGSGSVICETIAVRTGW